MSLWNIGGPFLSPCCITRLIILPNGILNTVLETCSGLMCTCLYASERSIFVLYRALANAFLIISWSVIGVTSDNVLSFHCLASMTVRIDPSFLRTIISGAVDGRFEHFHQLALMYLSTFSLSFSFRGSGHFKGLCLIFKFSFNRGMPWLTALNRGSLGSSGVYRSFIFLSHACHRLSLFSVEMDRLLSSWMPAVISTSLPCSHWGFFLVETSLLFWGHFRALPFLEGRLF